MIEACGGKFAYVCLLMAERGFEVSISTLFNVADSDDEAFGRAMIVCFKLYPQSHGFTSHCAKVVCISGISTISKFDESTVVPTE